MDARAPRGASSVTWPAITAQVRARPASVAHSSTPPTTLPSKLVASSRPSPVTTRSTPSSAVSRPAAPATTSKPGSRLGADRGETAGEATRRAAPVERAHVDTGPLLVLVGEPREPTGQQRDLRLGRALLRAEDRRGVDERRSDTSHATVTRHRAERPAEGLERGEPSVGRRAPADADDDPTGAARGAAAAISSPVPRVDARNGSFVPRTSASPLARAISTTAIPSGSSAHSASTGSPSGPVTST